MKYKDIISKVSGDTGIPFDIVDKTYKAFWLYVKNTIQELPFREELNEERFSKLRTSFNIPSLGKLCCTYQRYLGVVNRFNIIKSLRKKNEETN